MAQLQNILHIIESTFQVHIHRTIVENIQIENVQFLLPSEIDHLVLNSETLYVGRYSELKNFFLDGYVLLLGSCVDSGNEKGFYIYQPLDPFRICNCIQQELYHSHISSLKKEEMFHVLQAGYGIQSILDTARTYLSNPITLCTTSFSVLSISPRSYIDDKFDLSHSKKYLKKALVQNMKDYKILEHIFNSHAPIITKFDDDDKVDYMFCSIHIKNASVGYLCLNSSKRSFTEEDHTFVMELSKMLSIEMQKDDFYAEKSGVKYEYFMTDLLEQNFYNLDFATKRMAQLDQKFYDHFWILGFVFYGSPTNQINPKYYIDQLTSIIPNSMALYYKGALILLLSGKYSEPFTNVDKDKFLHFLLLNQMYYAISYRFENILDAHQYYRQVLFLIDGMHCLTEQRCISYENNYLLHLVDSSKDSISDQSLIHPDIHFLEAYDKTNKTEYLHTLRAFFENNRNALNTSKQLHIHKSTFFYRMGKISELTSFNLDHAEIMFSYEFSLKILDYSNKKNRRT